MDYSGGYEDKAKRLYPLILGVIVVICTLLTAPSGYFGQAKLASQPYGKDLSHFRQHCDLRVPSLMISEAKMTEDMWIESQATYRLVYELVLPFIWPMVMLGK